MLWTRLSDVNNDQSLRPSFWGEIHLQFQICLSHSLSLACAAPDVLSAHEPLSLSSRFGDSSRLGQATGGLQHAFWPEASPCHLHSSKHFQTSQGVWKQSLNISFLFWPVTRSLRWEWITSSETIPSRDLFSKNCYLGKDGRANRWSNTHLLHDYWKSPKKQ